MQVSTFGPVGEPLLASDGAIYWQRIWGGGLVKSSDKGKTWQQISNAVKSNIIELPDKGLAGLNGNQVVVSTDRGATWSPVGPPAPFNPNGIVYSRKGKAFFVWQLSDNMNRKDQSIMRLSVRL